MKERQNGEDNNLFEGKEFVQLGLASGWGCYLCNVSLSLAGTQRLRDTLSRLRWKLVPERDSDESEEEEEEETGEAEGQAEPVVVEEVTNQEAEVEGIPQGRPRETGTQTGNARWLLCTKSLYWLAVEGMPHLADSHHYSYKQSEKLK